MEDIVRMCVAGFDGYTDASDKVDWMKVYGPLNASYLFLSYHLMVVCIVGSFSHSAARDSKLTLGVRKVML